MLPAAGAALAALVLLSAAGAADDVPKPIRDEVNKMADAVGKGQKVDTAAAAFFKEHEKELKQTMWVFKEREEGGFGVGPEPGKYKPDGIEALLFNQLGRSPNMTLDPKQHGADLNRLADVVLAMAEITSNYAPAKKMGDMDPAAWKSSIGEMKKAATELKAAVKAESKGDLKKALANLNASCSHCHGVFRP
jgi:hypothetical protein